MSETFSEEIYDKISVILGLPKNSDKYWDIYDHIENTDIYLVHYNAEKLDEISAEFDEEDQQILTSLRGTIVDIKERWICCSSFPFTAKAEVNTIKTKNDIFTVEDEFGNTKELNISMCSFTPYYTGPIVRVWKYQGKTYLSSHHKISTKSKWGSQHTFEEIFLEYFCNKYPMSEDMSNDEKIQKIGDILFSKDKESSNISHSFMLCSPDILASGSRLNIGDGFLVYLKSFELNKFFNKKAFEHYIHHKKIEYENTWIDTEQFREMVNHNSIPFPKLDSNKFVKPPVFNYEIANKMLSLGYSKHSKEDVDKINYRIRPGESVILTCGDYSLKLSPSCVEWRDEIVGNNYNLYNQYCNMLNYSSSKEKYEKEYDDLFPELGYPTNQELIDFSKKMITENIISPIYYKKNDYPFKHDIEEKEQKRLLKKLNISYCFLFAVPNSYIETASELYLTYSNDFKDLFNFLSKNAKQIGLNLNKLQNDSRFGNGEELNTAGKAIFRIFEEGSKHSQYRRNNKNDFEIVGRKKRTLTDNELFIDTLKGLLNSEESLYSLFVASKKEKPENALF